MRRFEVETFSVKHTYKVRQSVLHTTGHSLNRLCPSHDERAGSRRRPTLLLLMMMVMMMVVMIMMMMMMIAMVAMVMMMLGAQGTWDEDAKLTSVPLSPDLPPQPVHGPGEYAEINRRD